MTVILRRYPSSFIILETIGTLNAKCRNTWSKETCWDSIKSWEVRLLKRSRTHTRTTRRDQDAGCIYVQIRERYQMHENIIKQQQVLSLLLRILLRILVHLVELYRRLVFLPCVEVIPEHTDRAARIKQSRVKMMRLKVKTGRGGRRTGDADWVRKRKREREKEKKVSKDFQRQG